MKFIKSASLFTSFFLLALCLAGCSLIFKSDIQYIPFKSSEDGRWGLLAPDGKVLLEDEYTTCPTVATCNRFWARNSQGFWELYSTDKTPKQFEGEYRYVSLFYEGKAFATPRDKEMAVVNTKGEVVVELKEIEGKRLSRIYNIAEGCAVADVDTLSGLINNKGEWIIKPKAQYVNAVHDGRIVVQDRDFSAQIYMEDSIRSKMKDIPEGFARVYDTSGKELLKLSTKKYRDVGTAVDGDLLAVKTVRDNRAAWGIINMKGELVVKPSDKYDGISDIRDGNYIYYEEEGNYGMNSVDGKHKIKARYKSLMFASDDLLIAFDGEDEDFKAIYLDLDGNKLNNKRYDMASEFFDKGKYAFVSTEANSYKIIDKKGERVEDAPKIYEYRINTGDYQMVTDHVEYAKFIKGINFTAQTLDDMNFSSGVKTVLDRQARYYKSSNKHNASDYTNVSEITIYRDVDGVDFTETIHFPTTLAKKTYRTEQVIDYIDYWSGYYWYHNRTVPTGTVFNSVTPSWFELRFDNSGVFRGKLRQLYKELVSYFSKMGSTTDSNNSATLFSLSNGRQALVYLESDNVTAIWGNIPASKTGIYQYAGNKEDLKPIDDSEEEGD